MTNENDYRSNCPTHNKPGKFIPPTEIDRSRRKHIVKFECPEGHTYIKEFDII